MFYTGIDPLTGKEIYVSTDPEEKRMQRALLQWKRPENAALVRKALRLCHREELIGYGKDCLVRPEGAERVFHSSAPRQGRPGKAGRGDSAGGRKPEEQRRTASRRGQSAAAPPREQQRRGNEKKKDKK